MIKQHQCQGSIGSTSNDLSTAIQQMLEAVAPNDELKRGLRMATTAAAVSEVAAQAGIPHRPCRTGEALRPKHARCF